ncbi:GNAT family N-acetyltransferase [Natrialbaceae archaeon A-arb3/5]
MESPFRIRVVRAEDAAAVRDIYAPFCESSAVTFEETAPSVTEMADRIESTLETHPWLVCERETNDGEPEVVGYASASQLRPQAAYEWVVELSIYVADDARRSGVGRALYGSLFAILERQGVRDAYAATTVPNPETVAFHERLGFERLTDFPGVGYAQGDWRDVAWWRRSIREKEADPAPMRPFSDVRTDSDLEALLATGAGAIEGD